MYESLCRLSFLFGKYRTVGCKVVRQYHTAGIWLTFKNRKTVSKLVTTLQSNQQCVGSSSSMSMPVFGTAILILVILSFVVVSLCGFNLHFLND